MTKDLKNRQFDRFIYDLNHEWGIWFLSSYNGQLRVNWHFLKVGIVNYKGSFFFNRFRNKISRLIKG